MQATTTAGENGEIHQAPFDVIVKSFNSLCMRAEKRSNSASIVLESQLPVLKREKRALAQREGTDRQEQNKHGFFFR